MQGFQQPITIMDALRAIRDRSYLLPAIQRRFVWSSDRVEALFDSLMRGYPINSFMFWEITEADVKREVRFYDFLQTYRQHFKEQNTEFSTDGHKNFFAVIDGQQRLTALYLGVHGSYAYKLPRVWLKDNEQSMPTRHLYLNLDADRGDDDELGMKHDFRFLSALDLAARDSRSAWFKVGDIVRFDTSAKLDAHLDTHGPKDPEPRARLRRLREVIHQERVINYYVESDQDIDRVLDIFIRTNSGGVPLSASDLLMSYTTAQWRQRDARALFDRLIDQVAKIGSPGFLVSKDFVLKTCLVLLSNDVRFKLANLNSKFISELEAQWDRIASSIVAAFEFLADVGFNDVTLRAKLPVIPIVQYLYLRNIEEDFPRPQKYTGEKDAIRTWLCMSLLKGVFRSQTDHVLNSLRKVIVRGAAGVPPHFPLDEIRAEYEGSPSRSLSFDDAFVAGMLAVRIDDAAAFPLLTLLYSHLDYARQRIDIDHLHPAAAIARIRALPEDQRPPDWEFVTDPANWNTIANLQPLNDSLNRSKQDKALAEWVAEQRIDRAAYLLPADVSLDIDAFKPFIEARRALLAARLRDLVAG